MPKRDISCLLCVSQASGSVGSFMGRELWCGEMADATRDSSGRVCTMVPGDLRCPPGEVALFMKAPGGMGSWREKGLSSKWLTE